MISDLFWDSNEMGQETQHDSVSTFTTTLQYYKNLLQRQLKPLLYSQRTNEKFCSFANTDFSVRWRSKKPANEHTVCPVDDIQVLYVRRVSKTNEPKCVRSLNYSKTLIRTNQIAVLCDYTRISPHFAQSDNDIVQLNIFYQREPIPQVICSECDRNLQISFSND